MDRYGIVLKRVPHGNTTAIKVISISVFLSAGNVQSAAIAKSKQCGK